MAVKQAIVEPTRAATAAALEREYAQFAELMGARPTPTPSPSSPTDVVVSSPESTRGVHRAVLHTGRRNDGPDRSPAAAAVGACTARIGDLLGGRRSGGDEIGDHLTGHSAAQADEHQPTRSPTAIGCANPPANIAVMSSTPETSNNSKTAGGRSIS